MRRCIKCGNERPMEEFKLDRVRPDGRHPYCRSCNRVYNQARYRRVRAEFLRKCKAYYRANSERIKKYVRAWKAANVIENPERKAKYQATQRGWRAQRPGWMAAQNARRRALTETGYTAEQWERVKIDSGHRCLACGRTDLTLEPDHVVPLSRGGSNEIENIQPLCGPCNRRKWTKAIDYRGAA